MINGQTEKMIIFGCGGHARSIINTIVQNGESKEIIIVDSNGGENESILGFKVRNAYVLEENDSYIVAIGNNSKRTKVYKMLEEESGNSVAVISKYSLIGEGVEIGKGVFIAPNTYIGPLVKIGVNTIINTASVVEHEVTIGNNTHIAPSVTICGRVKIGNNVFCGVGCKIVDNVSICDNVTLGAGTIVIDDIIESGTYVGIPAKKV